MKCIQIQIDCQLLRYEKREIEIKLESKDSFLGRAQSAFIEVFFPRKIAALDLEIERGHDDFHKCKCSVSIGSCCPVFAAAFPEPLNSVVRE